jgi:hypothetical protein
MTTAELTSLMGALSPVITGLAALAGVWLGAHLEAQRERLRAAARQDEGQRSRIRDRDLRDLDETRLVLVGLLAWLEERVVLGQVAAVQPSTDHLTRYNINLVADAAVIQTYGGPDRRSTTIGRPPTLGVPAARDMVAATEIVATGTTDAECLNGGWRTMHDDFGNLFKNQGDCIRHYATGDKNLGSVTR